MAAPSVRSRLYLVTPGDLTADPPALDRFAARLREAIDAGAARETVAALQLRLKDVPDDDIRRAAERLMPVASETGVAFVLNDRPDLAAELGCDGVHVGQDDVPYAEARRIVGDSAIVGVTCKADRHLAMEAGEAGADYVAFGAFFPTTTKTATTKAHPGLLIWWSSLFEVPCVAIGGIDAGNCGVLVRAGADFLAVANGVWGHPEGPAGAVAAFERAIDAAEAEGPLDFWTAEGVDPDRDEETGR